MFRDTGAVTGHMKIAAKFLVAGSIIMITAFMAQFSIYGRGHPV